MLASSFIMHSRIFNFLNYTYLSILYSEACFILFPHFYHLGKRCTGEDNGCCTKDTPCGLGEGDCDSDKECAGSLTCGDDNCPWGDGDDCCIGRPFLFSVCDSADLCVRLYKNFFKPVDAQHQN